MFGNVLWWTVFLVAGIWLERFIPGLDFLIPGFIVSLQEERLAQSIWLGLVLLLIQDGAGSLAFGAGIPWYGGAALLYYGGRWLFEPRNVLFMVLLGWCLGVGHFFLVDTLATLQEFEISSQNLVKESAVQALSFPLLWGLVSNLRLRRAERGLSVG